MDTVKLQGNRRARERVSISFAADGQGKTHQEHLEECDINTIVNRWRQSGEVSHRNPSEGGYGDFSSSDDYQTQLNRIQEADTAFASLPARIRALAHNSPARFIDMVDDQAELASLIEAGLQLDLPGALPNAPVSEAVADELQRHGNPPVPQPDTQKKEPASSG